MSVPYLISACFSPILGKLVDQFGYRAVVAAVAPVLLMAVHTLLGVTRINPVGVLIFQGFAYSAFAAVIWPSIPLVVEERYTGNSGQVPTHSVLTSHPTSPQAFQLTHPLPQPPSLFPHSHFHTRLHLHLHLHYPSHTLFHSLLSSLTQV